MRLLTHMRRRMESSQRLQSRHLTQPAEMAVACTIAMDHAIALAPAAQAADGVNPC